MTDRPAGRAGAPPRGARHDPADDADDDGGPATLDATEAARASPAG